MMIEIIIQLLIALCSLTVWVVLRRKRKMKLASSVALAVAITRLFALVVDATRYSSGLFLQSPYGSVYVLQAIVYPVGLAVIIFFVFKRNYSPGVEGVLDYSDPATLQTAVSNILDSESFLTALRSTMPQGKDDQQYGLDYIPFMLHSIDERRKRATRSARLFLLATVIAALTFSIVVIYFGYILVNEAAAGTAKSVADLKGTAQQISDTLQSTIPNYYSNPKFQRDVAPALEKLDQTDPGPKNKEIQGQIHSAINQAKNTGDFATLSGTLTRTRDSVSNQTASEKNYATALADSAAKLTEFMNTQASAQTELANRNGDLKLLIAKAQDVLEKPENRTPEIIKRLALGVVISTFFLALLRYLGTLYRTRYVQVLEAEKDDFTVRRFYVALKSSLASDEGRKAVLASFMAGPNGGSEAKVPSDDATKQEFDVIKELVQALSKKL